MDGANCFTTSACTLLSYILCHIQNAQVNHFSLLYKFPTDMKIGVCYSDRGLYWHASHKKGRKKCSDLLDQVNNQGIQTHCYQRYQSCCVELIGPVGHLYFLYHEFTVLNIS